MKRHFSLILPRLMLPRLVLPCLVLALTGCSVDVSASALATPSASKLVEDVGDGKVTLTPGKSTNSKMITHAGSGSSPYIRKMTGKHSLGVLDGKSSGYVITKKGVIEVDLDK